MFFAGSRYYTMPTDTLTRPDGSTARAVRIPLPGAALVRGYLRRGPGQRLDLIAAHYLTDATAFWRLCDSNNAVVPDALANHDLVGIPINAPVRS
jgi:hypothetical protein